MELNRFIKALGLATTLAASAAATPALAARADHPAVATALQQIRLHSAETRSSDADAFIVRNVVTDFKGAQHVRFDRSYKGLPVLGGDLVVHLDARGRYKSSSLTLPSAIDLDIAPGIEDIDAIAAAEAAFRGTQDGRAEASLVVYARGPAPQLAYDVRVRGDLQDGTPSERHILVDARTAEVLDQWDDVQTAASAGTGKTLLSGSVGLTTDSQSGGYALRDPSRGNHYVVTLKNRRVGSGSILTDTDNVWGNFTTSDAATVGADAMYGQNLTWDYYLTKLGRDGIDGDGTGGYSRVHYSKNYVNAYWSDSCFCMTYGDGDGSTYLPLVAIDVAGHEMTHGVTSNSADLTYSGESGGLNEAISDIFGTLVEYYGNNATNPPNYLIGERIYAANNGVPTPTTALRYMFKPSLDGISPDCYYNNIGNLDVHYSSGVANHFFYLLTQGATSPAGFSLSPAQLVCNGNTSLTAISQDKAARIVYTALTVYMTSNTNYSGARNATLSAAADLYGNGSTEYNAVAAAWSAVSVN
jgi:Zn-dependent metalloprotease